MLYYVCIFFKHEKKSLCLPFYDGEQLVFLVLFYTFVFSKFLKQDQLTSIPRYICHLLVIIQKNFQNFLQITINWQQTSGGNKEVMTFLQKPEFLSYFWQMFCKTKWTTKYSIFYYFSLSQCENSAPKILLLERHINFRLRNILNLCFHTLFNFKKTSEKGCSILGLILNLKPKIHIYITCVLHVKLC